jgi:predicted nucleotidyltransferase
MEQTTEQITEQMTEQTAEERVKLMLPEDDSGLVTAEKVVAAVARIVALAKPLRVVAFGSRARGDHRRDSDLDLAVIVEKYDPKVDKRPIWRSDVGECMSIDMLIADRGRHEYMRDSIISVHHDIANEGVVLYDSAVGSIDHRAVERIAR